MTCQPSTSARRAACRSGPRRLPLSTTRRKASSSFGCMSATTFSPSFAKSSQTKSSSGPSAGRCPCRSRGSCRAQASSSCATPSFRPGSWSASSLAVLPLLDCGSLSTVTNAAAVAGTIDAPRAPVNDSPPQPAASSDAAEHDGAIAAGEPLSSRVYCRPSAGGVEQLSYLDSARWRRPRIRGAAESLDAWRRTTTTQARARRRAVLDDLRARERAALHAGQRRRRLRRATSATRATTRSRAASTRRCTAAASGRCGSSPASARRRRRTSASATCSSTGRPGSRPPSTCRR